MSVPGAYFGDEGTFFGTVIHVSTTHIQVKWDMDDQFSKVEPKDLTLEEPDLPFQKPHPSPVDFKKKPFVLKIKPRSRNV